MVVPLCVETTLFTSKIGKRAMIGGQAGILGHLKVGDDVRIQGQSGITRNLSDQSKWYGTPAIEYTSYLKSFAIYKNLPNMAKKLRDLEQQLKELKENQKLS